MTTIYYVVGHAITEHAGRVIYDTTAEVLLPMPGGLEPARRVVKKPDWWLSADAAREQAVARLLAEVGSLDSERSACVAKLKSLGWEREEVS